MQLRFAWLAVTSAIALAGCSVLFPPKPEAPAPLEAQETATTRTFLQLAEIHEDGADWSGALAKLDKALAEAPRNRSALLRRTQLLLLVANAAGTAADLDEVRPVLADAQGTEDAELLLAQAWLDTNEGHADAAMAGARRAAELGADDARTQWMAARLLGLLGDAHGSLDAAGHAVERDSHSGAALRERARARLHLADFEGAAADLGPQLRAHPGDVEAQALEGETFWRLGDFDSASHAFDAIPSARRDAASWAALGWLALRADQRDAARSALEAGLAAHPTDAQVLDALLALDEREQRVGESMTRLDEAVAVRPDAAALARVRARALAAGNHHDEAASAFGRALALAPNDAAVYDALAQWLAQAKPEDADRRLVALGAAPAPTHVAQGQLRAARGDRAGAIDAYAKAVAEDPSLAVARSALARALATSGQQLDRAVTLAEEARSARPRDPDVAWSLGLAHLKRGQDKAAFEVLSEAVGIYPVERPAFGELVYTAAQALERAGEHDAARAAGQAAVAHAGIRQPVPSWKAAAQALVARLEPPKPVEEAATPAPASEAPAEGATATLPAATDPTPAAAAPAESKPAAPPATTPAPVEPAAPTKAP